MLFFKKKNRIAILIDGPNILRKEFSVDLGDLKRKVSEYGEIRIAKVFLNQYAPEKLIEAVSNQGFEVVIGMSKVKDETADVDVYMATEAMDIVHRKDIDVLAIATRDADFLPLVYRAKEHGKKVIVIGGEPAFSKALQHAADYVIDIGKLHKLRKNKKEKKKEQTAAKNK